VTKDALQKIPKRDLPIIVEGNGRDDFWGLLVVEVISFARVCTYIVMVLTLPFVFWPFWLSRHPGDFQNASVPVSTVIGLVSVFLILLLYK
jgi:hypothetical protein